MGTFGMKAPVEPRLGAQKTEPVWLRSRGWLVFLVGGLALALLAASYGDESAVRPVLVAMGVGAAAAILIGLRFHHPKAAIPWWLLAVCTFATAIGVPLLSGPGAMGLAGQLLTAAGSVLGFAGFILLIRGRIPGGDRAAILDAAMVASAIGVLIWAFGLAPYVLAAQVTTVVATISFYPTIVALAMVARLWFLPGRHRPATRLIVLTVIASNAIIGLNLLRVATDLPMLSSFLTFASFAELAFLGAAALNPAMAIAPEPHKAGRQPLSRRRIATLTAAVLVNPVVLAIDNLDGRHRIRRRT